MVGCRQKHGLIVLLACRCAESLSRAVYHVGARSDMRRESFAFPAADGQSNLMAPLLRALSRQAPKQRWQQEWQQKWQQCDGPERDCTRIKVREYSAQWDYTGGYGTQRRMLHNRRVQVRFLSHLPRIPEFMVITALWRRHNVTALPLFVPYVTSPRATPQVYECGLVGDGCPGAAAAPVAYVQPIPT